MDAAVLGTFISSIAVESLGNKPIPSEVLKNKIKEYFRIIYKFMLNKDLLAQTYKSAII